MVATNQMWLLSIWNGAIVAKKRSLRFYFILIKFTFKWPQLTVILDHTDRGLIWLFFLFCFVFEETICLFLWILTQRYVYKFLEREEGGEKERERETSMWERNINWLSPVHATTSDRTRPRYVPWPWIRPVMFWCMGWLSRQLCHPARAITSF